MLCPVFSVVLAEESWCDYIWIFNAIKGLLWASGCVPAILTVIICECVASFMHNISVSCSALFRQNNYEVHEFITLLWESSFWYFCMCTLRRDSHYDPPFPDLFPFYVTLWLFKPLFQICSCFVCPFLSSPPLPLFCRSCRWVLLLFPSYHQWDLDPIQSKI